MTDGGGALWQQMMAVFWPSLQPPRFAGLGMPAAASRGAGSMQQPPGTTTNPRMDTSFLHTPRAGTVVLPM